MSIRLTLFDFFSDTIPGIFYILIFGFWLNAFGVLAIDISAFGGISLSALLILIGAAGSTWGSLNGKLLKKDLISEGLLEKVGKAAVETSVEDEG